MNIDDLKNSPWYAELMDEISDTLTRMNNGDSAGDSHRSHELESIDRKKKGWTKSLSDPDLPDELRNEIKKEYEQVTAREKQLKSEMQRLENREQFVEEILDPNLVVDCLNRLDEVLAGNNATAGNLELSLHIDDIQCFDDGQVKMRLCHLGVFPQCVELFRMELASREEAGTDQDDADPNRGAQIKQRRRAKLRVDEFGPEENDRHTAAEFATDPYRFSELGDEWFEVIDFQVPDKKPWYEIHAEEVYLRRQESNLSFDKLAKEFGVSGPTASDACKYYLKTHPESTDHARQPLGKKRPPKFDLSEFGNEARVLWVSGWSKLKLADKFGCSSPTIDKALNWSYEQDGLPVPSKADLEREKSIKMRALYDAGASLAEIASEMKISDVTVRKYLKMSFKAEGKSMPDLRKRSPESE